MSTISFTWEPNPDVYARAMLAVQEALADATPPLVAASEVVQLDIAERFQTETDPHGVPWEPWSPSYAERAIQENVGILWKTGALYDAATSTTATVIRGDTLFYNTQVLPSYGLEHDEGNPERGLPQREFLGMSENAQGVVFGTFAEWFDRSIDLFVTASGKIGKRHAIQGPGGFVSRASVGKAPL